MSRKIIKIELYFPKIRVKNQDLHPDFLKVPLLKDESGTFKTQKCHFYQTKQALFSLKSTAFSRILRVFHCALLCKIS